MKTIDLGHIITAENASRKAIEVADKSNEELKLLLEEVCNSDEAVLIKRAKEWQQGSINNEEYYYDGSTMYFKPYESSEILDLTNKWNVGQNLHENICPGNLKLTDLYWSNYDIKDGKVVNYIDYAIDVCIRLPYMSNCFNKNLSVVLRTTHSVDDDKKEINIKFTSGSVVATWNASGMEWYERIIPIKP